MIQCTDSTLVKIFRGAIRLRPRNKKSDANPCIVFACREGTQIMGALALKLKKMNTIFSRIKRAMLIHASKHQRGCFSKIVYPVTAL